MLLEKEKQYATGKVMVLKSTHYDILKSRSPVMFEYIKKDIQLLFKKGINGPFESIEQYTSLFDQYFTSNVIPTIISDTKATLEMQGYSYSESELLQHLQSTEEYSSLLNINQLEYVVMTNFELFHKKVFHVSDNLVEQLSFTNLDVDSELIIPPFDCCLFVFTSQIVINAFYQIADEKIKNIDYKTPINVFVTKCPATEGKYKLLFACWQSNRKTSNMFVKRELLIKEGWRIDEMLKTDWNELYQVEGQTDDSLFYQEGLLFFRILLNVILYLASNEPDIIEQLSPTNELNEKLKRLKSKAKRKKILKKIDSISELDSDIIGSKINNIIVKKPSHSDAEKSFQNFKISKKFLVRGHWRRQSCGVMGQQRKLIWIKPYYKGPDMAELVNKSYTIK